MATIAELFERAVQFHQAGDLQQADPLYRQIIQLDPSHTGALNLLGLAAHQKGHPDAALALIRQAIALNPGVAAYHSNLGAVLQASRQPQAALLALREAIRLDPTHADAHNNLGILLNELDRVEEALYCFRQALWFHPHHGEALKNLGNVLKGQGKLDEAEDYERQSQFADRQQTSPDRQGNLHQAEAHNKWGLGLMDERRFEEAIGCFREALKLDPRRADTGYYLGNALMQLRRAEEASDAYRQSLHLNAHDAGTQYNLGNALLSLGRPAEAADCYRQALKLNPGDADALNNLGNAYLKLVQLEEAHDCYRQALRLNPNSVDTTNNLGNALLRVGRPVEALDCYRQVLRFKPDHAEALNNLGNALMNLGELEEALAWFSRILDANPASSAARLNRSLIHLLRGDCLRAWPDYEARWRLENLVERHVERPRWMGERLDGKLILLHAEQGLGDVIQFIRYAPLVQQRGGVVLFECQPALRRLLQGVRGIDRLLTRGETPPIFDVQLPLLSLPGVFATTLANLPADIPYLTVDPQRVDYWRGQLEPLTGLKIGIVWQGSPANENDRYRSVPLSYFEPLLRDHPVCLVSLQKGPGSEQLKTLSTPGSVIDLGASLEDFADTAAVLKNLDLVICVDTAVAHCAGALGVPVWLLLPLVPDWRWLLEREDSPWYPTLRLFRQKNLGDWTEVFERISVELAQRIAELRTTE